MPIKNFDFEITDIKGSPIEGKPLAKDIVVASLLATYQDEPALKGEDKYKRWKLADKIQAGNDVELTTEELVLIKTLVGKYATPMAIGPIYNAIENDKPLDETPKDKP